MIMKVKLHNNEAHEMLIGSSDLGFTIGRRSLEKINSGVC